MTTGRATTPPPSPNPKVGEIVSIDPIQIFDSPAAHLTARYLRCQAKNTGILAYGALEYRFSRTSCKYLVDLFGIWCDSRSSISARKLVAIRHWPMAANRPQRSDRRMKGKKKNGKGKHFHPVTLQMVADHVGLTKGTCSAVLNNSAASRSIPQNTKERVLKAARELRYRPSFYARNLKIKRTYMIGVVTQEIGDFYSSPIISGIERYLRERKFFFLTVAYRHEPKLLQQYEQILADRGVEGFIAVDTFLGHPLSLPTIAVAGHQQIRGVTNVVLDHRRAAWLALNHLLELGHRDIAFMKGSNLSSDTEVRWKAIEEVAQELKVCLRPELIVQLEGDDPTPQLGYPYAKELLARGEPFIGSIRAFQEAGLRVPEDISVVGFDDIQIAMHNMPSLSTVRQPLQKMGELAAKTLLDRIEGKDEFVREIIVEPDFVARSSTTRAPAMALISRKQTIA
jgi:DNA-binding LacI/PurR family transcriptional regulator